MKIIFYNQFEHIWFKHAFENIALTKVVHIYVIESLNA